VLTSFRPGSTAKSALIKEQAGSKELAFLARFGILQSMPNDRPLSKLPDSQVFSRDPESIDAETEADIERRMTAISERLRRKRAELGIADRQARDVKAAKGKRGRRKKETAPDVEEG
jgi:hypothetical protein